MSFGHSLFPCTAGGRKCLKAFLCFNDLSFPRTHDIEELLDLCATVDGRFSELITETAFLTDYAVVLRYDFEFWPEKADVEAALEATNAIRDLVLSLLCGEMDP